jgi:hypothetical protein
MDATAKFRWPRVIYFNAGDFHVLDIALLPFSVRIYQKPIGYGYNSGRGICAVDGFAFGRFVLLWPIKGWRSRVLSFFFSHVMGLISLALFVILLLTNRPGAWYSKLLGIAVGFVAGASIALWTFRRMNKSLSAKWL